MTTMDEPKNALERVTRVLGTRLEALFHPVDIAWLVAFRVLFGLALAVSMERFIHYGWVDRLLVAPRFHFKYWGFRWVEPLGSGAMHYLFVALIVCALCISAGFLFRLTATAFALGLTYIQLIDVSTYLNHYYLAALMAWLVAFSPAHRAYSVDAWLGQKLFRRVDPRGESVAVGWLYLLRFQVGIVYTFAGLAKAQSDWLIHAQPLRIWLGANTDLPLVGPLFTLDAVPLFMSWFGFLFDTTIVWWLSFSKTRPYAYVVVVVFHVATRLLFPIGMFPIIMMLSALMFFSPSWPRVALTRLRRSLGRLRGRGLRPLSAEALPAFDVARSPLRAWHKLALACGLLYCTYQAVMPLRYLAYGGNVLWHEQGMRYSWRVMLRAKGGSTTFLVRSLRTGETWYVSPRAYLNEFQENEMSSQPDLILQLAHHVRRDYERRGLGPVEVRADSRSTLNGRRSVPLIDASVDLSRVCDGIRSMPWVLPAPTSDPPHTHAVL